MNQWLNPLKRGTGSNLVDVGRAAVRVCPVGRGRRLRSRLLTSVGRPSGKACGVPDGEAAAAKLGVDPVDRDMVNVGTVPGSPSPASSQLVGGQAHRQLMTPGRGGGSVVVRGTGKPCHMAKGPSEFAATVLECQEVAGEHRRAVADAGRGEGEGTGDPDQAAPMGDRRAVIVGSMTCSTSSPIPPSLWWRGIGCGAIEEHDRPASMG